MHQTTIRKNTKRFFSGSIATLFLMLQLPLMLLASPSVGATSDNGLGNTPCAEGTVLLAKFNYNQGTGLYVPETGGDTISISATSTASSGSFTVIKAGVTVSALTVKAGDPSKTFFFTPPVTQGTFNNTDPIFTNNPGTAQRNISNLQFCGTVSNTPTVTTGNVNIVKDVFNGTNTQDFGFVGGAIATPTSEAFTLDDDGDNTNGTSDTKSYVGIAAGQYTVTENAVDGWKVRDIVCSNTVVTKSNNARTATFTLVAGQTVTCTFVNEIIVQQVTTGSVDIVKDVKDGVDEQNFDFTGGTSSNPTSTSFTLDDDGDNTNDLSNTASFTQLAPGEYTVTESAVNGWNVESINCTNTEEVVSLDGRTVAFTLAADTNVTCTFVNEKDTVVTPTGTVTIIKEADPETGESFSFSGNLNPTTFVLSDDGDDTTVGESRTFEDLELGKTFTVTESAFPGWNLEEISCTTGGTRNVNERNAVIVLTEATPNVTCTFTNVKEAAPVVTGSITIVKRTNFSATTQMFDFTSNLEGSFNFRLSGNNATNNSVTKSNLDISKTYTVTEAAHEGWTLDSIVCTTGAVANKTTATVTINLTNAHKDVTCTFTNKAMGGIGGEPVQPVVVVTPVTPTTPQAPVLNLFVPAKVAVGGASTTNPGQLVDTGSTMLLNVFAGLFVLGMVAALTATNRRQYS